MKKTALFIISVVILFTKFTAYSQNREKNNMKNKLVYIGMSIDDFKNIYPEVVPEDYSSTQAFERQETIAGIDGKWYYDFKDSKLTWFQFDRYFNEINQANFDKCLKETRQIIADYKEKYGEPIKYEEEETKFKDPYKERHWGYDVTKAVWQTDKMKILVEFHFMGGKGEYNFIIKIDFQDRNYEYF
jgi:TPP-dependent trihydroxycyclohexane-1,2-dione (THcHDO) dehydratase